jgi:hypothetical protein
MPRAKLKRKTETTSSKRGVRGKKSPARASPPKLLGKTLERAVKQFQSEPDEKRAHEQWKEIEASVFGVQFED